MAKETALELFVGVDHEFSFPILDAAEAAAVDVSGWSMSWMVKRKKTLADADKTFEKTTGGGGLAVTGVWNATPASSTQRVVATVEDTDTDGLKPGTYYHELKRTGAGVETILSYGELELLAAVHKA